MPRFVRNFWIELDVDGRKNTISAGPKGKNGGFDMNIYIREKGCVPRKAVKIVGVCGKDNTLRLFVNDELIATTER